MSEERKAAMAHPADLTERIEAVIRERMDVARAIQDACGGNHRWCGDECEEFQRTNDPADAILSLEYSLGILERHRAINMVPPVACQTCCDRHESNYRLQRPWSMDVAWPCTEVRALAKRYGVEVE